MKRITPVILIIVIITLLSTCAFNKVLHSQTIVIDSIITSNCEIFPFNQYDTIYGIGISGEITLYSDTSLIRVVFVDNNFNEFLLYEAYPYIVPVWEFNIANESDETKYLDATQPYSIRIQIINCDFEIESLAVEYEYIESADSLQNLYKTQIEAEKIL